ncbi:MAG: NAD(P)-dependent oxidoreductase [Alphaproteobacteria bacterium]|nr:NAD(P)-dependent oxidoreductase [Alphaproteobacteria bacterium]
MRVLLTGATGFVGGALAARLCGEGHAVHAVIRPTSDAGRLPAGVTPHVHDGRTDTLIAIVAAAAPEVVIHAASLFVAQHRPADIEPLVAANLLFGTQLLEAMDLAGVRRLINTGTSWQHYRGDDFEPVNLYAATKRAFEALLDYYVAARGFAAVDLLLYDTYGPGDPRRKVLALLLGLARDGGALEMSPGEQKLDLVHIDDVCDAFLAGLGVVAAPGRRSHAVASGRLVTLKELAGIVEGVTGRPLRIAWGARPYRDREVMLPWPGRGPLPGWRAKVALEAGIAATWEAFTCTR